MGSSYSVPVFKRTLAVFVLRRGIGLACRYRLINMSSFRKLKDFDEKPDKCCMPKNEENIYPRIEILDSASHFDPKSGGTFSNQIVGTNSERIIAAYKSAVDGNLREFQIPPLWDGKAAERIVRIMLEDL